MNDIDFLRDLLKVRHHLRRQHHRKQRKRKTLLKYPGMETIATQNTNELYLAATDVSDHLAAKLIALRENKNTLREEITLLATSKEWCEFVKKAFKDEKQYRVLHYSHHSMMIINNKNHAWMDCSLNADAVVLKIMGSDKEIKEFISLCVEEFDVADSYIEWVYSSDGQSVNVPLRTDRKPFKEMYPFLKDRSLEDYYNNYLESDASILVLIGPPGTGKTTFIRGLLQHTRSSALVTYDTGILEKDYVFAQFIEGDNNVMVVEDADNFLKARKDGNTIMHRFLNVGDGLVTTKRKKLIFSTNLPSTRDIDPALIRPGRCFDILHFDNLTHAEATTLADKANLTLTLKKDNYTLAEVFNNCKDNGSKKIERKVGFI